MRDANTKNSQRGSGRAFLIALALFLCLAAVLFLHAGRWLVREDPLTKCTAIVVLSGAMPERALQAAEIYREGYAPEVWITQPTEPKQTMMALGVPFDGEDESSRRVLIDEGVPEKAIHILSPGVVNTADEVG